MSFTTYIKTVLLSGFFIGASFASSPVPSKWPEVVFERTAHGLTLPCPERGMPDELTSKKMMQIIEAFKEDKLTQDLPAIKTLLKDKKKSCTVSECVCNFFDRSNGKRRAFEEKVVGSYEDGGEAPIDRTKPFQYISYGSGFLFQDLVIAMKLIDKGFTDLTLVLVDNHYADFFTQLQQTGQSSLQPMKENSEANKINNALYYMVTFFGYLKHMRKDFNFTIKVYDEPQKAIRDLPGQSCDLLYAMDLSLPENVCQQEIDRNQLFKAPMYFDLPCTRDPDTQQWVTSVYFKMADALLKDKSFHHVWDNVTYRGEALKLTSAVHINLDSDMRAYVYHQENIPGFGLVADNHYKFYINQKTNNVEVKDFYTGLITHAPPYCRALLSSGQPLSEENIRELRTFVAQLDATHQDRVVHIQQTKSGAPASQLPIVPFKRTAHGLVFPCPKIVADRSTMQKMQEILAKVKNYTLTQDDATLKSLTPGEFSGLGECRCKMYERSKGDRTKFENKVVETCKKDSGKPFTYINYGSGLLFQDLVIATKLIQAGCRNITLIFIDPEYAEFNETFKDVQALQQYPTDNGAVQINNALYVCSTYFSLLKNLYPDLSVTLKVYENAAQAMQDTKPQSVQLIFTADFGDSFENVTKQLKGSISGQASLQNPEIQKPYYQDPQTGKDVLREFFVLADALLMQNGIKMRMLEVTTVTQGVMNIIDVCHHYTFKNMVVSLDRRTKDAQERSYLVINNRYRLSIKDNGVILEDLIEGGRLMLSKQMCPFLEDVLSRRIELDESHAHVLEQLVANVVAAKK